MSTSRNALLRSTPFLVVLAAALAACGGSGRATTANTSTPVSRGSVAASTTTTMASVAPLGLGTAYVAKDGSVTLTVQDVKSIAYPSKGSAEVDVPPQVGGALVKGCVASGDGRFTWDAWTVADPTGLAFFHFGPTDDQPKPHFPAVTSDPLATGRCTTGWVYFDLAKGTKIARVTWTNATESASWSAS